MSEAERPSRLPATPRPAARGVADGRRPLRHSGEAGFTLIEMLVALAVFSIAALALLRLEGATVATTARLQDHVIGEIVARNVAITALTDPVAPARGTTSGHEPNAGRDWLWTRTVSDAGDIRVQRIDVQVAAPDGRAAGAITMFRGQT